MVQCPHSDGPDQLLCEVSFTGDGNGRCTPHMPGHLGGCGPHGAAQPPPVHHRSLPSQSPWKTQCAQSNQNWLNAPPWNVTVSTECGKRVVLALVPMSGNTVLSPEGSWAPSCLIQCQDGCPSPSVVAASDAPKGTVQGARDCNARGEILRPLQDQQRRRRSARARSSIKSESLGIEDDQTPS